MLKIRQFVQTFEEKLQTIMKNDDIGELHSLIRGNDSPQEKAAQIVKGV